MKYFRGNHTKPIATYRYKPTIMKTKTRGIQDLSVITEGGLVLDFGDQVESIDEIEVGMTATIEGGGTPDGDYTMPDGRIFVFDAGTLTEIKFPPEETTETMRGPNVFGDRVVYMIHKGRFLARAKSLKFSPGKPVLGI